MAKTKLTKAGPPPLSLRLDEKLDSTLTEASRRTRLSKSDVARLSIERGISILLKQLETPMPDAA